MKGLHRRTMLRGVGGAAIALPLLEIMMPRRPARAQAGQPGTISKLGANGRPKRFVVVWTSVGQGPDWFKNTSALDGSITQLGPALAPMAKHQKDLILIENIAKRTAMDDLQKHQTPFDAGHRMPQLHGLACMPTRQGAGSYGGPGQDGGAAGGISIDQEIANHVAGDTKFPSIQLTVSGSAIPFHCLSWKADATALPPMNPQSAFNKLFSDLQTDPAVFESLRLERKSILDNAARDYGEVLKKLGGDDFRRVQSHLEGLREVEKRLGSMAASSPGTAGCSKPVLPKTARADPYNYIDIGNMQMDIMTMAFACDLTRVATCIWADGMSLVVRMPWCGVPGLHDASHGDTAQRNLASKWHAEYFGAFFDRLKAAKDGPDGSSVFDNTLFYWCSDHGAGNHNIDKMTILVAGSAGGYFTTGRRIVLPEDVLTREFPAAQDDRSKGGRGCGPGHGELFVSFLNAMGVEAKTFGQAELCRGPLPGLVV